MTRDELNSIESRRLIEMPLDERKHFLLCADCGQAVDCRRLGDVFHHEEAGHEPIPANG